MLNIKTLEFPISNCAGTAKNTFEESFLQYAIKRKVYSPEEIDKAVNECIANIKYVQVKDIRVDYITIDRHNNGGCDTMIARYTIIIEV